MEYLLELFAARRQEMKKFLAGCLAAAGLAIVMAASSFAAGNELPTREELLAANEFAVWHAGYTTLDTTETEYNAGQAIYQNHSRIKVDGSCLTKVFEYPDHEDYAVGRMIYIKESGRTSVQFLPDSYYEQYLADWEESLLFFAEDETTESYVRNADGSLTMTTRMMAENSQFSTMPDGRVFAGNDQIRYVYTFAPGTYLCVGINAYVLKNGAAEHIYTCTQNYSNDAVPVPDFAAELIRMPEQRTITFIMQDGSTQVYNVPVGVITTLQLEEGMGRYTSADRGEAGPFLIDDQTASKTYYILPKTVPLGKPAK